MGSKSLAHLDAMPFNAAERKVDPNVDAITGKTLFALKPEKSDYSESSEEQKSNEDKKGSDEKEKNSKETEKTDKDSKEGLTKSINTLKVVFGILLILI